jgi:hypothetical protein
VATRRSQDEADGHPWDIQSSPLATVDCRMPEREMGIAWVAWSPMQAAVMAATAVHEEVMGWQGVSDRAAPGRRGLDGVWVAKSRLVVSDGEMQSSGCAPSAGDASGCLWC